MNQLGQNRANLALIALKVATGLNFIFQSEEFDCSRITY